MAIYFSEIDDIYFPKTKEYFQEVISSYSIGNYRSATVMLYSVAICDILFKLQELKDMYNDTVAEEILKEVEKSRSEYDNKAKSKWEKELIDNVYKKTELLDLEAVTNLNHLYDHRNFSAHPALNENYDLIAPSKETTIANIKNILNDILVKPPIFIKNIVNTLSEDLKEKNKLYEHEYGKLAIYLNNKYFIKMSKTMKLATLKAFWKFCFCLPDNEDCMNNLAINRKALRILISTFQSDAIDYIKQNNNFFGLANDENCQMNLVILLSHFPMIYDELNSDTQLQIDTIVNRFSNAMAIAWFKYKIPNKHFEKLKTVNGLRLEPSALKHMIEHYLNIGEHSQLIDFFIEYYRQSYSYDSADERFEFAIEPLLDKLSAKQFEQLITVTNSNRQIWDRGLSYSSNNKIMRFAKDVLPTDFKYSKYTHFIYDQKILNGDNNEQTEEVATDDTDWPF